MAGLALVVCCGSGAAAGRTGARLPLTAKTWHILRGTHKTKYANTTRIDFKALVSDFVWRLVWIDG